MKKILLLACIVCLFCGCSKPDANFNVSVTGTSVYCYASDYSYDSYEWTWGDYTEKKYGYSASHTYAKAGDYTITLTVEKNGNFATKSKRVHCSSSLGGGGSAGDITSYKSFVCNSIKVTKMPLRDGSSRWDANSDADLFFRIYNSNSSTKIYECSNYIQNVSSLPVTKKLSTAVTFNKESSYKIELWDWDDLSSNDFIGSVSFSGSQIFRNGLATSVTLTNSSGTISIALLGYMD